MGVHILPGGVKKKWTPPPQGGVKNISPHMRMLLFEEAIFIFHQKMSKNEVVICLKVPNFSMGWGVSLFCKLIILMSDLEG